MTDIKKGICLIAIAVGVLVIGGCQSYRYTRAPLAAPYAESGTIPFSQSMYYYSGDRYSPYPPPYYYYPYYHPYYYDPYYLYYYPYPPYYYPGYYYDYPFYFRGHFRYYYPSGKSPSAPAPKRQFKSGGDGGGSSSEEAPSGKRRFKK